MNNYFCHGLHISSEIPLLLMPSTEYEKIDVNIRFGNTPESLADPKIAYPSFEKTESQLLLKIKEVAHFLISNGCEIIISPLTQDHNLIAVFLYGSCFGALLKQRGILTIHANAIIINNKASNVKKPFLKQKGFFILSF